jgi:chromosome segregation ATPase
MEWLKSKTMVLGLCGLTAVGLQGYAMMSLKNSMDERLSAIESDYNHADDKITRITSDLDVVSKKVGVTTQELQQAQAAAVQLKQENAQLAKRLRSGLATKADTKVVRKIQDESTTKLNSYQQETTTKIDGINGQVQVVRTDLDSTRMDLKATRSDLSSAREEMASNKRELGTMIARNSTELGELRRRGERDYVEFDLKTTKDFQHIGDVMVQLRKTDPRRQKYEVVINADDTPIQKKDRTANEPVTFLVGRDRLRYELVVNLVDKDRIRGYISAPKDKLLGSEKPTLRVQ